MVRQIRRVVTGFQKDGRSTFIADSLMPPFGEDPNWPTRGVTPMWNIAKVPASNAGNVLSETVTPPSILPGLGGISFIIMHIAPESELEAMPAAQRAQATVPVARTFDGAYELDTTQGYGMHGTNTVDLCIILSGEVSFLVDDGEVTLKQFDMIIDRGANHGWVNRGKEVCLVACAVVDTEHLDRSVYRDTMVVKGDKKA
jgi:quercetin dioxygenase-like cupin family protein